MPKYDHFENYGKMVELRNKMIEANPEFKKYEPFLLETAEALYDNGFQLLKDAEYLYEGERYPRSISLAILGMEEVAKAHVLALIYMWGMFPDGIKKTLCCHDRKLDFVKLVLENHTELYDFQIEYCVGEPEEAIKEWDDLYKDLARNPKDLNKIKLKSLYVMYKNDNLKIQFYPNKYDKGMAQRIITKAKAYILLTGHDFRFGRFCR